MCVYIEPEGAATENIATENIAIKKLFVLTLNTK